MSAALAGAGLLGCGGGGEAGAGGQGGHGGVAASSTSSVASSSGSTTSTVSSTSTGSSTGTGGVGGMGGSGGGTTGAGGGIGAGTCADPIDITSSIAQAGKYDGVADQILSFLSPGCGGTGARSRTLRWTMPVPGNYHFQIQGQHVGEEDQASVLQISSDCQKPETELACGNYGHDVRLGLPVATTLLITASGTWFDTGFTLTITKEAACATDQDCYATNFGSFCDPSGACVECNGLASCSGKLCDATLGQCLGCAGDADCAGNPKGTHCGDNGYCSGCLVDAECATSTKGPVCLPAWHSCGCNATPECTGNQQCLQSSCTECLPGAIDCNGIDADACEVDPQLNPAHCGGCNGCNFGGCNTGVCTAAPVVMRSGKVGQFAMDATTVFLDDGGAIYAQPKAGGAASLLVPAVGGAVEKVLVDATHVYYVVYGAGKSTVSRVAKGGGAPAQLWSVANGFSFGVLDIEVDATDLYIMYDGQMQKTLVRMPRAGGPTTDVLVGNSFIQGDFLLAGSSVYYSDFGNIYQLPKAGGSKKYLFQGYIETDGSYLYSGEGTALFRYDLDGTNKLALGAPMPGWKILPHAADASHVYFDGSGPAGTGGSSGNYNAFVFAVPKAGGAISMVGSGKNKIQTVDGDVTWTFFSTDGKLLRATK